MLIGALSGETGFSKDTIRYYEELGLIHPAYRRDSNYREYNDDAVSALLFIKRAKQLGFTLSEIKEIIEALENRSYSCDAASMMVTSKVERIDEEIERLNQFKARLIELARSCGTDEFAEQCPAFERLWHG